MPLPDERPVQSVANLIGRFETQQKRTPKSDASKPIQLPGRTVSGLQDRKANLGPDLANNLLRNAGPRSETVPVPAIEPEKVEPVSSVEPIATRAEEDTPPVPEVDPASVLVEASEPVVLPPPVTRVPRENVEEPKPTVSNKSPVNPPSTSATPAASLSSSSKATTLKITKARSPPRVSVPMTKSKSATQQQQKYSAAVAADIQPLRPHHTGNTSVRGATSPIPHYMTPTRQQNTGTPASEGKVRSKSTMTKQPRTSTANGAPTTTTTTPMSSSSHLMAPTASSLAKARPPVAATPKSNNSVPATASASAKKAATKTSNPPTQTPQTPQRQRTNSSIVPFPSARKGKTSTGPSSVAAKSSRPGSTLTPQTANSRRQSRISQSSSKGPSAAALAAVAKVNAPPVPTIPTSSSTPAGAGSRETHVDNVEKSAGPSALASNSNAQTQEALTTADAGTTAVKPIVGSSTGKALVVDSSEGAVIAPPANPLTGDALQTHDTHDDHLGNAAGEVRGGTSVIAIKDSEDAQQQDDDPLDTPPKSTPINPVLENHHDVHVVPPTPTSPNMDRDHKDWTVDPSRALDDDGDELKDDANMTDRSVKTDDIPDMG